MIFEQVVIFLTTYNIHCISIKFVLGHGQGLDLIYFVVEL